MRLAPAPHALQQLIASHDTASLQGQRVQEAELRRCQLGALAVYERLHFARVDPKLLELDRLAALRGLRADATAHRGLDARHELLHRERLDEVVVGPDLERVDAVVLGPARADDDDRRPDALRAGRLDHAPPVAAG